MTAEQLRQIVTKSVTSDMRPAWLRSLPHADSLYYRFLYLYVELVKPGVVVEIGIDSATSTAHLASAHKDTKVISIDIEERACENARAFKLSNLHVLHSDSLACVESVGSHGPVDLLFIDGLHQYDQAKAEYDAYKGFVRPGGLILFDDIKLDGMVRLWDELPSPKMSLSILHHSGFGAVLHQ